MNLARKAVLVLLLPLAAGAVPAGERVPITLLQINDVYEISPVQGGVAGGMARLAALKKQLMAENPRTFLLLAGDAFSPSALGTAVVDGKPLAGAQMVAALNAAGLDYATFGNHEFDVSEASFHDRIRESKAVWFSGNVRDAAGKPFAGVPDTVVFKVTGAGGGVVTVGLVGVTIGSTKKPWVSYLDPLETAGREARALRPQVDILVALTHLSLEQDATLAALAPEFDLILGGHEHENWQLFRGARFTPILKADANARTAYVHRLVFDTGTKRLEVRSVLQRVTADIADDPDAAKVVRDWTERGFAAFRAAGFKPEQVVALARETYDGKEASVRNHPTNLTDVVAAAMLREWPEADAAVYNAGSIRIDDDIPPGPITQYDVLRILPFGGKVLGVELSGSLLARVLEAGRANRGTGGYLQTARIEAAADGRGWTVGGQPLDPGRTYRVAIDEFLLTGGEQNLGFLSRQAAGVGSVKEFRDIRFALIDQWRAR